MIVVLMPNDVDRLEIVFTRVEPIRGVEHESGNFADILIGMDDAREER